MATSGTAERLTLRLPKMFRVAAFAATIPLAASWPALGWITPDVTGMPSPTDAVMTQSETDTALLSGSVAAVTWRANAQGFPGYVRVWDRDGHSRFGSNVDLNATVFETRVLGIEDREMNGELLRPILAILGAALGVIIAKVCWQHFMTREGIPWPDNGGWQHDGW